jgi:threonine synthase
LGARRIGAIAWPICQRFVAASHLVEDEAITAAQQRLWRELRLAVEPAAALPLAALASGLVRPAPHERVALVICGAHRADRVMVNGRWVVEDGAIPGLDLPELLAAHHAAAGAADLSHATTAPRSAARAARASSRSRRSARSASSHNAATQV